jgi:hypothetical protein
MNLSTITNIMTRVIRIPADIYLRLEKLARGFDSPAQVIERLLNNHQGKDSTNNERTEDTPPGPKIRKRNTVEDWQDHIEIAMSFKHGVTGIGDSKWTRNIYEDFCKGEVSFGATSTPFVEALLCTIKSHEPSKYQHALNGLRKTIEHGKGQGKPLIKLTTMYEKMGGQPLTLDN